MIRRALVVSAALFLAAVRASAADLVAGPVLGHVTGNSARVWMQFSEAGQVTINATELVSSQRVSGVRLDIDGPSPFVCDVPISNLQPDRSYRIDVKFDGEVVKLPAFTIRTAPVPGDEATFSVAFGSDVNVMPMQGGGGGAAGAGGRVLAEPGLRPILAAISETKPRAFFFLGNTGHLPDGLEDFPTTHRAAYKFITDFHGAIRKLPELQQLLTSTPTYAIFSDHDLGPADATGSYVFGQESLVAFKNFWPNPDWGTPENPGCFSSMAMGDVEFFLLDTRTFRDAAVKGAAATVPARAAKVPVMLGGAQLDWLKKGLKASKASFKVIAAPCTLWGDTPGKPDVDSWSRFPEEQKAFLDWLGEAKINGVVAIAGNHAAGEVTKFKVENLAYPIYTLACSSLNLPAGARPVGAGENPLRQGPAIAECTFGTLEFAGAHEHRFVTLHLRDEKGKVRAEQTLFAVQLHN